MSLKLQILHMNVGFLHEQPYSAGMGLKAKNIKCIPMFNLVKHSAMNDILGARMYRSTFYDLGTQMGVSG
jgi:hypothetical protein